MGRLTKNRAMAYFASPAVVTASVFSGTGIGRRRLGRHRHPVLDALQALDHHLVAGRQSLFDHPQRVHARADLDVLERHLAAAVHDRHAVQVLQLLDRSLLHEQRADLVVEERAGAPVLPRAEEQLRIREQQLDAQGPGRRVDRAIHDVDLPGVGIHRAVGEGQLDAGLRPALAAAVDVATRYPQVVGLGDADAEERGIDLGDGGQQRALARGRRGCRLLTSVVPTSPLIGRRDAGVAQIERRPSRPMPWRPPPARAPRPAARRASSSSRWLTACLATSGV